MDTIGYLNSPGASWATTVEFKTKTPDKYFEAFAKTNKIAYSEFFELKNQ